MGITFIINGIVGYILSTLLKYIFKKDKVKTLDKLLQAILIKFKKGDPFSAGSFLQLICLFWLIIGIINKVWESSLQNIPEPVLLAGNLFIPFVLSLIIMKFTLR